MTSSSKRSSKTDKSKASQPTEAQEQIPEVVDAEIEMSIPSDTPAAQALGKPPNMRPEGVLATPPPSAETEVEIDISSAESAAVESSESNTSLESAAVVESSESNTSIESIAAVESTDSNTLISSSSEAAKNGRGHPIAPPSEPKQYRAIGLVRGRYTPDPEQFTRGFLHTPDGTEIDAVLLGRVMSLLKNHLDLESEHLWVVYPRTRQQDDTFHVQIMGVWEPETLEKNAEDLTESTVTDADDNTAEVKDISGEKIEGYAEEKTVSQAPIAANSQDIFDGLPEIKEGYFSVRGEVIYQSQEEEYAIVKIRQSPRKGEDGPKFFKLKLEGILGDRPVHHFWDLHLQLQSKSLVIQHANDIGSLVIKGGKPFKKGKGNFPNNRKKDFSGNYRGSGKPAEAVATSRAPLPKPVKRNKPKKEGE